MIERDKTKMEAPKGPPVKEVITFKFTCLKCGKDFELERVLTTPRCDSPFCKSARVERKETS